MLKFVTKQTVIFKKTITARVLRGFNGEDYKKKKKMFCFTACFGDMFVVCGNMMYHGHDKIS